MGKTATQSKSSAAQDIVGFKILMEQNEPARVIELKIQRMETYADRQKIRMESFNNRSKSSRG